MGKPKKTIEFQYVFDNYKTMSPDNTWDRETKKRIRTIGLSMFAKDPKELHKKFIKTLDDSKHCLDVMNGKVAPLNYKGTPMSAKEQRQHDFYKEYLDSLLDVAYLGTETHYCINDGAYMMQDGNEMFSGKAKKLAEGMSGIGGVENRRHYFDPTLEYDDEKNIVVAGANDLENFGFDKNDDNAYLDSDADPRISPIYLKMAFVIAAAKAWDLVNEGAGMFDKYGKACSDYCEKADIAKLVVGDSFYEGFFDFVLSPEKPKTFKIDPTKIIKVLEEGRLSFFDAITSVEIYVVSTSHQITDRLDYLKAEQKYWRK